MTLSQILKESLEEFESWDVGAFQPTVREQLEWYKENGADHGDLVLAEEAIFARVKHLLTTHTIKLLEAEIEHLKRIKKKIALLVVGFDGVTKKGTITEKGYETLSEEMEARGYNQALQDQITHLQEEISKIKE